ncbi:response regulator transcription factor [Peribacillus butanolivorans]|uniref:response regulator transcription factor n=1 Tax=Peribacillus butanolivorans TaxID=421767 RepID=UPI00207D4D52|nr:response regulator transcription factor [Peribacillus butanolivorans]MCO0600521.1 response regulator transcription factor [Peribacillus butanolivorans]
MSNTVYLVEDNKDLNFILKKYLENEGYKVEGFLDGQSTESKIHIPPDLWILDIMLPDTNGYTLFNKIKGIHPEVPIIFISAKNQDIDRVVGLELGCDDYISKPFLPRELVIKVKKLLDYTYGHKQKRGKHIKINDYIINRESHTIYHNDTELPMSSKEFQLMLFFIDNANHVFSREQILDRLWGKNYYGTDRVVDDTIRRIRKKTPGMPIETVYGAGYRLVER